MRVQSEAEATTPAAWVTWPLLIAILVAVSSSLSTGVLGDPDTLWHIAAGRWMVEHRQLPMADMFSWTRPGTPWTAHEWLSELLLFGVWSIGGFHGVVALVAVCFALTAAYIVRFLCERVEPQQVLPIALLFLGMVSTHFLARPHVIVWPLMAVWIGTLVHAVDAQRTPPWWLLPVLLVWANLHASFTLALGVAAALALDALVRADARDTRLQVVRTWGLFGAACLLMVAINPNGLGTLTHALHMMQMKEMLALIVEWKSADFHEFQFLMVWVVVIVGLALLGRVRLSPVRVLLLLGLLYIALKHVRYHSTLALASVFLLAEPLRDALRFRESEDPSFQAQGLDTLMRRLVAPTHPVAAVLGILLVAGWMVGARGMIVSAPPPTVAPERAIAAYEATGARDGRLLNAYGFGGYLIFRGIPVFVDGRADMYGDPFMKAYAEALMLTKPHGLERYLDQHRVTWTLLGSTSAAAELLDHLPTWRRLYQDSVAVVHVRQSDGDLSAGAPSNVDDPRAR